MLSWSAHHGADGRIPKASVSQLAGPALRREVDRAIKELAAAGVLVDDGDAYLVRDYLDANISKERDDDRRRSQNARQSRHRAASVTRDASVTKPLSLDHDHEVGVVAPPVRDAGRASARPIVGPQGSPEFFDEEPPGPDSRGGPKYRGSRAQEPVSPANRGDA
jgi:hypothetical protein